MTLPTLHVSVQIAVTQQLVRGLVNVSSKENKKHASAHQKLELTAITYQFALIQTVWPAASLAHTNSSHHLVPTQTTSSANVLTSTMRLVARAI